MKRSKKPVKYQGFALEIPLINDIKKHINHRPQYRSVTDFVRAAVREKIDYEKQSEIIKKFDINKSSPEMFKEYLKSIEKLNFPQNEIIMNEKLDEILVLLKKRNRFNPP